MRAVCVCVCVCVWYAPFCDALKLSRVTFLIDFYDRHMGVRAVDLPTLLSVLPPPRLPGRQAELRDTSGNLLLSDKILQSVVSVRLCLSNKLTSDVNVFACVWAKLLNIRTLIHWVKWRYRVYGHDTIAISWV